MPFYWKVGEEACPNIMGVKDTVIEFTSTTPKLRFRALLGDSVQEVCFERVAR